MYNVQYIYPELNSKTIKNIELKLGSNIDIDLDSIIFSDIKLQWIKVKNILIFKNSYLINKDEFSRNSYCL